MTKRVPFSRVHFIIASDVRISLDIRVFLTIRLLQLNETFDNKRTIVHDEVSKLYI